MGYRKELKGQRFGRLVVVSYVGVNKNNRRVWLCRCDCGNLSIVQSSNLKTRTTLSCGCHELEGKTKHGMSKKSEYIIWLNIIERCFNKNNNSYMDYGGRGILMCPEWRNSFERFYCDMGPRPSKTYSIDRIDNNKGYSKSNCRWATSEENSQNRRNNVLNKYKVKRIKEFYSTGTSITELSKMFSVSYVNIYYIVNNKTWKNVV